MAQKNYKKFVASAATATLVASAIVPVASADVSTASFTDVPKSYEDAVNFVVSNNFALGLNEKKFGIDDTIKRGDFALILAKAAGLMDGNAPAAGFSDVPKRAALAVNSLKAAGVVSGVSDKKFGFDDKIKRGDAAVMLQRALKLEAGDAEVKFSDVNERYEEAVAALVNLGVTNGINEKKFGTDNNIKRGDFAKWIYALKDFVELPDQPEVPGKGDLGVEFSKANIKADGSDTSVVTFKILDAKGNVDTSADDIVLRVQTTHGTLATERVTVQNGIATVTLTSEASNKDVVAKVDATVIEAGEGYKELIGKKFGSAEIGFVADDQAAEALSLTGAESNQVDRVTLYFDRAVELEDFVKTVPGTGELLYQIKRGNVWSLPTTNVKDVKDSETVRHALKKDALIINELLGADSVLGVNGLNGVLGLKPVKGNAKAIEVILEKGSLSLPNNQEVTVESNHVSEFGKETTSKVKFNLTDARTPEVTKVTNSDLRTIEVKFSEAIEKANFKLNGKYTGSKVTYGGFDARSLEDNRDTAYLELGTDYDEKDNKTPKGYMAAKQQSLEISNSLDFAGNKGKTQNLTFNVTANTAKPVVKDVKVASPEQFEVEFNAPLTAVEENATLDKAFTFEMFDKDANEWKAVKDLNDKPVELTRTKLNNDGTKFKLEMPKGWDKVLDTAETNYYNEEFRIVYAKDSVKNTQNGIYNDRLEIDLSYANSPLTFKDVKSPVIDSIKQTGSEAVFTVTTNEPVKIDAAAPTALITATDYSGKKVEIAGTVKGYADKYDDKLEVVAEKFVIAKDVTENGVVVFKKGKYDVQELVDLGYFGTDFTLILTNLTDDVGNKSDTVTQDFKMTQTVVNPEATPFFIKSALLANDKVVVSFSEAVQTSGTNAATNIAQWNLNGKSLPTGTTVTATESNKTVTITLPAGNDILGASNIITLNREIVSHDGSKLVGKNSVVLTTLPTVPTP